MVHRFPGTNDGRPDRSGCHGTGNTTDRVDAAIYGLKPVFVDTACFRMDRSLFGFLVLSLVALGIVTSSAAFHVLATDSMP